MAFEAILTQQTARPRGRRLTLTLSLVLHAVALTYGVVLSLWHVEELPLPAVHVTLATSAPPPPPPPPPAARTADSKPKKKPVEPKPTTIVEPKQTPQPEPEEAPEPAQSDEPEGQAGGEQGGVAGGVVGGVVGGTPPPPPAKDSGPKLVSAQVAKGQLLIDPNLAQYRVSLPAMLARGGLTYFAVLRVCVSAQGAVTGVQIMRPAGPAIDPQIPGVLARWRYRPLLLDGKPSPFCYLLKYEISAR
jgi:protein TonB